MAHTIPSSVRPRRLVALVAGPVLAGSVLAGCSGGDAPSDVALSAEGKIGQEVTKALACAACHSSDGSGGAGPTWKGLYGSEITLEGGEEITADDDYIRRAIRNPTDEKREGVGGIMPAFDEGRISDEEIDSVIAYLSDLAAPVADSGE